MVHHIAVIGTMNVDTTLVVDHAPVSGEGVKALELRQSCGGKGANSAIACFRASHTRETMLDGSLLFSPCVAVPGARSVEVHFSSIVGDDLNGRLCLSNLEKNGLSTAAIDIVADASTGQSTNIVEASSGSCRNIGYRGANDLHVAEAYINANSFCAGHRADLLISHLALPMLAVKQMFETAARENIDILLNAAPAHILPPEMARRVIHLIVNEVEAALMLGLSPADVSLESCPRIAQQLRQAGSRNVVITLGGQGAYYLGRHEDGLDHEGHVPATKVVAKDTTGAGDTFVGAYAAHCVQQKDTAQWDIQAAVQFACEAAAYTVRELGAQTAMPWANEIMSDSLII